MCFNSNRKFVDIPPSPTAFVLLKISITLGEFKNQFLIPVELKRKKNTPIWNLQYKTRYFLGLQSIYQCYLDINREINFVLTEAAFELSEFSNRSQIFPLHLISRDGGAIGTVPRQP